MQPNPARITKHGQRPLKVILVPTDAMTPWHAYLYRTLWRFSPVRSAVTDLQRWSPQDRYGPLLSAFQNTNKAVKTVFLNTELMIVWLQFNQHCTFGVIKVRIIQQELTVTCSWLQPRQSYHQMSTTESLCSSWHRLCLKVVSMHITLVSTIWNLLSLIELVA